MEAPVAEGSSGMPSCEELTYILEQQDGMMASLMDEVHECKNVIDQLRAERDERAPKGDDEHSPSEWATVCKELATSHAINVELQSRCEQLEQQLLEIKDRAPPPESAPVVELLGKIRDVEFERDRGLRELEARSVETKRMTVALDELRADMASKDKRHFEVESKSAEKVRRLEREVAELRMELTDGRTSIESSNATLRAELDVCTQRCTHLEMLAKKLTEEDSALRQEHSNALIRIKVLQAGNDTLREQLIRHDAPDVPVERQIQVQKLLGDHSSLIGVLKEECTLLAEELVSEKRRSHATFKTLKREKKQLEARIEKLLKIE